MASYTDLLTATLIYQNIRLDQRSPVRQDVKGSDASFRELLTRSLETTPVKTLAYKTDMSPAFSQEELEDQLKFRECLNFVLGQEGEKYVADDGGKESSKFGMLQSTAKSLGYKGDIKNLSRAEAEGGVSPEPWASWASSAARVSRLVASLRVPSVVWSSQPTSVSIPPSR